MATSLSARAAHAATAAVGAVLRALQRRARLPLVRAVLRHWLQERGTARQGVLALSIGIGITLMAGVVLGAIDRLLAELPGLLILTPAAIGMRGAIFGALGARLGTGMLTGQLDEPVTRRSFLGQNVEAAMVMSAVTAVLLAAVAKGVAALLGLPVIAFTDLVVVSVVGTILSSVGVLVVVIVLTRTAQRQHWDMDAIATPVISAAADITTLPALVVGAYAIGPPVVSAVVGWTSVAVAVAVLVMGLRTTAPLLKRVIRESLPVLLFASVMGVLAGTVLEARKETLISSAALLVAVPPFIASSGAIGGILSARLSSQLHLGLVAPTALPGRPALLEGSLSVLFAGFGYLAVGVLSHLAAVLLGFDSPGLGSMVGITLVAGALAVTLIFLVGYYAATASLRFGLDPDNVSIPLVTSTMDLLGILCLVAGMTVVGMAAGGAL